MNYMNISDLCQCRAQVQKSVNVPLLQKSVRKMQPTELQYVTKGILKATDLKLIYIFFMSYAITLPPLQG